MTRKENDNRKRDRKAYFKAYRLRKKEEIKKWDKEYKFLHKEIRNAKNYGVTKEFVDNLRKIQNGKCAICGDDSRPLCIDHCHKSKKVRGLLCSNCNIGIGNLRDSIELIKNAVKYLENYLINEEM